MRLLIAPALLATLLGGCDAEGTGPTDVTRLLSAANPAVQLRAGQSLPFSGSCVMTFDAPPFPIPPIITQTDVGECKLSHLGHSTVVSVQSINLASGTQTGRRTYTAANGDQLHMTHVGTSGPAGPGLVRFQATATIIGGTGRFTGATGEVRGQGVANLVTRTTIVSMEGTISYEASDRGKR